VLGIASLAALIASEPDEPVARPTTVYGIAADRLEPGQADPDTAAP